jgi:hypothetical protein
MLMKRLVNTVVSVPTMLLVVVVLIAGSAHFSNYLDYFERAYQPTSVIGVILACTFFLLGGASICVMFGGALVAFLYALYFLCTGDGLLWLRVDKGEFLQNLDGSVLKKFDKADLIWRWDPNLRGRKVIDGLF